METVTIHKPVKKRDFFTSKITQNNLHNKPVRINVYATKFVSYNGQVLRLWIPTESSTCDKIDQYDKVCFDTTIANNAVWFNNSLTSEQIESFFRKSINQNILALAVSDVRPPVVFFNQQPIQDLTLLDTSKLATCHISADIEAQGLYFFTTKFGMRWMLRTLYIEEEVPEVQENMNKSQKEEIENQWAQDIENLRKAVHDEVIQYRKRIDNLHVFLRETDETLETAKRQPECTSTWNELLEELSLKVSKYYGGGLFYL